MNATVTPPTLIEKETINELHFPEGEVLESSEERALREVEITQAMRLGNGEKYKVKIIFEDKESIKEVRTTIWAVTDKRIVLKRGVVIPFERIHRINFF